MNSLTRICHGVTSGSRQGRSRRDRSYQLRRLVVDMHGLPIIGGCGMICAMPNTSPVTAWKALKEGNERFVAGRPQHPSQSVDHRASLAAGQKPTAVVF